MRIVLLALALTACTTGKGPSPSEGAPSAAEARDQASPEEAAKDTRADDAPAEATKSLGDEGPPAGVKAPGNLPVMTQAAVDAANERLMDCIEACDEGDAECRKACRLEHDIGQVEISSGPLAPPPPPAE